MFLPIKYQPFHLALTLTMGQALRWRMEGDGWISGVVRGKLIRVRQVKDRIEFHTNVPEKSDKEMLSRYLRLDQDIVPIHKALSRDDDPEMQRLVKLYGGMRILRQDPWECLITYAYTRRAPVLRTAAAVETLACRYGETRRWDCSTPNYFSFPTTRRLLQAAKKNKEVLDMGLPQPADYVYKLIEGVDNGSLNLNELTNMCYSNARQALMRYSGIGSRVRYSKIAECILLFGLDKAEAFPIDTNIRSALKVYFDLQGTDVGLLKSVRARGWRDNAGYVSQLLFAAHPPKGLNIEPSVNPR